MKAFFVALVALPAALASPLAAAFPMKSVECTCMNAAGATRASGLCQLMSGGLRGPGEWCYRASSSAPSMDSVFNNAKCAQQWGAEWNRGSCRSVSLCQAAGGPNYYTPC